MNIRTSLQDLSGVGTPFLQSLSPQDTYIALLKEALELFGAEHGSIFLRFHKRWHRVYTTIPEEQQIPPRSRGFAYAAFKKQAPIVMTRKEFIKNHHEAKKTTMQSMILIPLSYNNQSLGVVTVQSSKKQRITKKQESMLKIFSSIATLAIKKTQLYEESEEAIKMRDLFIALAAHELRTPLTTINVYVQLLQKKLRALQLPEASWIEGLSQETSLIITLVNELLNVDLIRQGIFAYRMRPLSLHTLVKRSLQQFSVSYPFHQIEIVDTLKGPDKVLGDPDKLLQMLSSLLQNGAKFSAPEKKLLLILRDAGSSFAIDIQDRGIGIPQKDLQKIFTGFYKGGNNHTDGMGLGLFLSKKIVEKHKGSISIHSQKNKGTTVSVLLPKASL